MSKFLPSGGPTILYSWYDRYSVRKKQLRVFWLFVCDVTSSLTRIISSFVQSLCPRVGCAAMERRDRNSIFPPIPGHLVAAGAIGPRIGSTSLLYCFFKSACEPPYIYSTGTRISEAGWCHKSIRSTLCAFGSGGLSAINLSSKLPQSGYRLARYCLAHSNKVLIEWFIVLQK